MSEWKKSYIPDGVDLVTDRGRQRWTLPEAVDPAFLARIRAFRRHENPNSGDRILRALRTEGPRSTSSDPIDRGWGFYRQLQAPDGHWPGDYGGPLFLLPGLVLAAHVIGRPITGARRDLMTSYLFNHQQDDGGWGLHIEGASTQFGTVMNYVALRLLGLPPDDDRMARARRLIHAHGGAVTAPPWATVYLAILGVFDWRGNASLAPELWLLPRSFPLYPGRFWCHTRMVYLPMSYLFGVRFTHPLDDVTRALREELYTVPYDRVDWRAARFATATSDVHAPLHPAGRLALRAVGLLERLPRVPFRRAALRRALAAIDAEDRHTDFIDIGPVSQVLNTIVCFHAHGPDAPQVDRHVARWDDYLWLAEDGLKMQGYNGSQLWDTAFAVHALTAGGHEATHPDVARSAYGFLRETQIVEEVGDPPATDRHPSVGGWPFSTQAHGWPISDCTALGLSAVLRLHRSPHDVIPHAERIPPERLRRAVDVILSLQNLDGSWSTYERQRTGRWIEALNPAVVFGDIMVDHPHVECTSSCVQALVDHLETGDDHRRTEVERAVHRGTDFILRTQEETGGWFGNWGICYHYGTWFALDGLARSLEIASTDGRRRQAIEAALSRGADFIERWQRPDGGWGEHHASCTEGRYVPHAEAQAVQIAWAVLALCAAGRGPGEAVRRGVAALEAMQLPSGDFPQQAISGVFNQSCMITYTAYRNVFPLWAMSAKRTALNSSARSPSGPWCAGGRPGRRGRPDRPATPWRD